MGRTTPDPPVSAVRYHDLTSHVRHRISPHSLDFSRYPAPFKTYEYQRRILLNPGNGTTRKDQGKNTALSDLKATVDSAMGDQMNGNEPVGLETVSRILSLSYGVTLADRSRGIMFRSVPSAGGLYPCQLYLSVQKTDDIETGLYYCDTVQGFLGRINPRPLDLNLLFPGRAATEACMVITGIFYHSAWKYRERAFRYLLLDAGHLAEAVVQSARATGVQARICYDFDDHGLVQSLNLDAGLEVPLACVFLGSGKFTAPLPDSIPFQPAVCPPNQGDPMVYDILSNAHQTGTPIAAKPLVKNIPPVFSGTPEQKHPVPAPGRFPAVSFVRAVTGRRSRRNFVTREVPAPVWSALLNRVFDKMFIDHDPDETGSAAASFVMTAMISQNMQGLTPGLYAISRDGAGLTSLKTGDLAEDLARVCLDQPWIGRAAVNFLMAADLAAVEAAMGARGYRYVMMHAGRIGHRVYMAAQKLGMGCCGIGAMYDGEAVDLLGLTSGSRLLYALSAGPVK
ncbi:MAG: SagB family peptide dehydrogenase [Desulfotignum sp.]|nr:SagB family peptide dehydrogenase [Desulfotignum sp.]